MIKIGSHVGLSGSQMYEGSVLEAVSYGANAFMVYTGAPQNTIRKAIKDLNIEGAEKQMQVHGLSFDNVVVHAPYIINLANPDPEKRAFAVEFLSKEVERTHAMHVKQIVLHPGSAVGKDRQEALEWIAEGVNKVIENTKNLPVKIALETMAGKGNEMGKTFEEIRDIIARIDDKSRVSVCFDTCHTSDAGYDIQNDFEGVIKHFDEIVGKSYISVFHVNDSKNPRGAAKDRHANLGFGEIGFDALLKVIYHSDFKDIPKILETPYIDDKAPYKFEIEMVKNQAFNPNLESDVKKS
ncbi:deoxyribonuclease IV [Acholeplasma vituli]|uniref:Probable endonuclease 4 n=1 Tax=Paracholeplasma vituli TaxID=69473 RepID=A0ABT2PVK2_9MOLU|nr:deoxyribonuclease IV [Paracholeplasma vituli]MCU0104983.1 deoxyribonuclease IV [Paracholeplasma vituli]